MILEVPDSLNRNAKGARAMGDPADTGLMLINYMCRRLGIDSLAGLDVLDFGCGVRFTQSIVNRNVPIGSYTGVEVEQKIVDFLKANITDPRLAYVHMNTVNVHYNPAGEMLVADGTSPLGETQYDIACMFSVITHQQPSEAAAIFNFLQHHVRPDGRLFFSALIHDDDEPYREGAPDRPGLRSSYSLSFMKDILENQSWALISVVGPRPDNLPIQTSFLCKSRG